MRRHAAVSALAVLATVAVAVALSRSGGLWSAAFPLVPLWVLGQWARRGRWAAATSAVALGLGAAMGDPADAPGESTILVTHLALLAGGVAFAAVLLAELRRASETAWTRAQEAEASAFAAREAREARGRFLAAVGMELRAPLHVILDYSAVLLAEEKDEGRADDLRKINGASQHLLKLVEDLLDLSRARSAAFTYELTDVDAARVVAEVVETTAPLVRERKNRLAVVVPPDVPLVRADRGRLRQILINLVSNAIKYTENGTITIAVRPVADMVEIAVRDEGIGISPDQMSRLFQPFVQLHEGTDRRPGIGLGLALSRELAQRMGGDIAVQSEVGRGSTFIVALPARALRPSQVRTATDGLTLAS